MNAEQKMKKSLTSFNRIVHKTQKLFTEDQLVKLHRKISLEALARIILKTPVDTGRARGNWQVGINKYPSNQLDVTDKSGDKALAKGIAKTLKIPPFANVWISNNVDYIIYLEEGTSKQSPKGMIKLTIEELKGMF